MVSKTIDIIIRKSIFKDTYFETNVLTNCPPYPNGDMIEQQLQRNRSIRLKEPSIAKVPKFAQQIPASIPSAGPGTWANKMENIKTRKKIEVIVPKRELKNFPAGFSACRLQ